MNRALLNSSQPCLNTLTQMSCSSQLQPHRFQDRPTAYFWSGDAIRSRSVSDVVLTGTVDVSAPPTRLAADWKREVSLRLNLEPGDVEELPLPRARARWPEYDHCVQAVAG